VSAPHATGVIAPHPDEPPDASLEALTRAGLTPAHAYQAQVYLNSPAGQQSGWNGLGDIPAAALRPTSLPNNGASGQLMPRSAIDVPTLGVNIDSDSGGLGLDFAGSSPSDLDTDEGSSELPWARPAERRTRGFSFILC
jgi:RHO1 GDP-GTP exchange protein 1/2